MDGYCRGHTDIVLTWRNLYARRLKCGFLHKNTLSLPGMYFAWIYDEQMIGSTPDVNFSCAFLHSEFRRVLFFISISWTSDARYIILRLSHHLLSSGRHPMQNDACSFRYYLVGTVWSHNRGRTEFRTGETLSINYKGRVSNTRMNSFLIILYILMRLLLSQIIFESSSMRRLNYFKDFIVPRKLFLQNIKIEIVKYH